MVAGVDLWALGSLVDLRGADRGMPITIDGRRFVIENTEPEQPGMMRLRLRYGD
jgi:hypothetical protein